MSRDAYKYVLCKYANLSGLGLVAATAVTGSTIISRLNNDSRRKAIIEDLARNDMLLRQVPKDQLISWYGVICQYGPKTSLNKEVTKELLHTFARFGKIDMPTLKTIADTEKSLASATELSMGRMFGNWLQ